MEILRRLPFRDTPHAIEVAGENVPIRAYQIVVWVSLSAGNELIATGQVLPSCFPSPFAWKSLKALRYTPQMSGALRDLRCSE